MFYVVQHDFLYGWDNAGWSDDGKPLRFETREEAQKEINDLCQQMKYNPEDYRIVEVKE